jgi:hypothetical protein
MPTRVPRGRRAPGLRLWLMTRPRVILVEYARLTRPSRHRVEPRSRRACATVFLFTFGTTQGAWVGGRTAGGDGDGGGGGSGGGGGRGGSGGWGGRGGGGGRGDLALAIKIPSGSSTPPAVVIRVPLMSASGFKRQSPRRRGSSCRRRRGRGIAGNSPRSRSGFRSGRARSPPDSRVRRRCPGQAGSSGCRSRRRVVRAVEGERRECVLEVASGRDRDPARSKGAARGSGARRGRGPSSSA